MSTIMLMKMTLHRKSVKMGLGYTFQDIIKAQVLVMITKESTMSCCKMNIEIFLLSKHTVSQTQLTQHSCYMD